MSDEVSRPRSGRLRTQFGVRIGGVDSELEVRRGDVSLTGVYFELEPALEVGALGSVQALQMQPLDGREPVEVMARIVRIKGEQRLFGAPILSAIAFQFLPENDEQVANLESMIRRCVEVHAAQSRDMQIELHLPADNTSEHATIKTLGLQEMTLKSNLPIPDGQTVTAQLVAPRSRRQFDVTGTVVRSLLSTDGEFTVHVELVDADEKMLTELIDELIVPTETASPLPNGHEHLQGSLDRVKVTSLINFFAMDRVSGVLTVNGEKGFSGQMYFQEGTIIDAVGPGGTAVETVRMLTHLEFGEFSFEQASVEREDRVN
ncbi:MAG: PilZ domain-containing protein, partial [Myxococcota bacterium]